MGYEAAIEKAWDVLAQVTARQEFSVKFLADEYSVDRKTKKVFSLACNVPAKDFTAILILHYLAQREKGLPQVVGQWVSFKELSAVEGYESAFRTRSIEPIVRKYGRQPEGLLEAGQRFNARKGAQGDVGIIIEVCPGVPVMVLLWRGDDEFGPEANILFDRSITGIFCTEDIVVVAGVVAAAL
jgi:hypothetical protein